MVKKIFISLFIIMAILITGFLTGISVNANSNSSIEQTNVSYDLKILYGGNKPTNYDLNKLLPNANNDKDINFKFFCVKPVDDTLYIYLYHREVTNADVNYATFNISTSKVQKTDGSWVDSYNQYNARFINSYGYQGRFMKFAVDGIVNSNDSFRFAIKDVVINYKNFSGSTFSRGTFTINDEAFFNLGSNATDFVYEYYKDDYVRITDADVKMLLTKSVRANTAFGEDIYNTYNEDTYYFFSTDKQIDELVEIQYDYQYITYEAKTVLKDKWIQVADLGTEAYTGLMNKTRGTNGRYNAAATEIIETNSQYFQNQSIKQGANVITVTRPTFMWWTHKVTYKMENIIDVLDTSKLETTANADNREKDYYKSLRSFVNNVQNDAVKEGKQKYQWAFRVRSDERKVINSWNDFEWYYWVNYVTGVNNIAITECHEVKQTMITWLHFRTNNQDFKLNALDIPKDTTSIYADNVPFDTLLDVVFDNFKSLFNDFGSILKNLINNIVPILILVASIMLLIIGWPFISAVFSVVGGTVKYTGNKAIENKKAKDKKRAKKTKG